MDIIKLHDDQLLGSGNERRCYIHPQDPSLCIKVNRPDKTHRAQNKIEEYYFTKLQQRNVPFTHIPKFYGVVETNLGKGLVFERIFYNNHLDLIQLVDLLKNHQISSIEAKKILNELYQYLIQFGIILGDINADQVAIRQKGNKLSPVIIDGIGTRRFGFKLIMMANFPSLAKRKVKKNWPTLLKKLSL